MTTTPAAYVPDNEWHRSRDGLHLVAGSPMRAFTVTDTGATVLDAIQNGTELPTFHSGLTERLLNAGAIHPVPSHHTGADDITVVIPAHITDNQQQLRDLIESLAGLAIVVVDDASPNPVSLPASPRVTILRHETNHGPGVARNTGIAHVATEFVAFIDVDARPTVEQLQELCGYAALAGASLVAPRIVSTPTKSVVGNYEMLRSSLDMGDISSLARPGGRVSYVPSTVLVGRAATVRALGTFSSELRFGEDVDLSWRYADAGQPCRYVPTIRVTHAPRATVRSFVRQRFNYGTSAAQLDKLRPWAVTPFRSTVDVSLTSLLIASGYIATGLMLGIVTLALTSASLRKTGLGFNMRMSLAWRGLGHALSLLSRAVTRVWWPVVLVLATFSARASVLLVTCTVVPIITAVLRQKPGNPFSYMLMRILDDASYGAGVWAGAIRNRSARCLFPVISLRRARAN